MLGQREAGFWSTLPMFWRIADNRPIREGVNVA